MKQLKKIMISTIIGIIGILGFFTTINAYYVGQNIGVTYNEYLNNGNIYCVEYGQALKDMNQYQIISQVKIEGYNSTDHTGVTQTSWHNAKLAYILSADNGLAKDDGPVANSIWNYMYTWLSNVGKNHAGLYTGFSNGVQGSETWLDSESSAYANNLGDTTKIVDNTQKDKIKMVAYVKDENNYMRVGPFNWSFPGNLKEVIVNDQNGKAISGILFSSFNGENEYWYPESEIKTGTDFYISVPMDSEVNKITTITGRTTATVKGVTIWFLESIEGYKQNVIIREPYDAPVDITTSFDYNIDLPTKGDLKVIKVKKDKEEVKLKGVGFYIRQKNTGKYVHQDENKKITYVEKEQATEFITDDKGEIFIEDLLVGSYIAYETKNPNYGYEIITEGKEQEVVVDKTAELVIPNEQIIGNLKVIKVNKDNQEVKLKGVGFYLQYKETGKYVHIDEKGNITYVEKEQATEFETDENGEIFIENLLKGTYVAYETKNPNYGYEIITEGIEQEVIIDKTAELVIPNEQVYVKLSGYVWIDNIDGKTSERNALYNTSSESLPDTKDVLFNGITVKLKDRTTGETIKETVTSKLDRYKDDGNGEYLFTDVLIEKLKDYYIEFEYDGLTYTNVIPHIEENSGSKAAESEEERTNFNQNFSIVEGETRNTGFTRDAKGDKKHNLSYNINETGHEATLINNGQYKITANTEVANYIINDHFTSGEEEIRYINLGLYEREQPDIALVKDLQNVKLTINGYEHTYVYAQRFINAGEYGDGFNVGVKFGSKYGNMSYTRAIYKADYEYINDKDKDKELKVYVTYKLTMRNESSNLIAQVNSIVDYYDSKYQIIKVGDSLDERNEIVGNIAHTETTYNENYTKTIIDNRTRIGQQKEESIYVQFVLNREAVINILNDKENLNNVAEINSYSIYDGDKIYAGIDIDSNPGNCVPGDTKTYEDDTDSSPALKLEVADAREMAGKVFLDSTSGELKTGEARQGSGIYEEGEKGIEGVEITLTENTGSGKVYTAKTDANGDFFISDYIPGDYTLTYTWGDETYTVQDYKGTVYNSARNQNNKNWYKEEVDIRYTDAIDNYSIEQEAPKGSRKQIDSEIATTNGELTRTKMDSTTPIMGIGVEYETTYTASSGDKYTYQISNVDFGIVERARQALDISKNVTGVKITLANGQTIIEAKIVDGKLEGESIKGLTYMGPSSGGNGLVKAEIDNELIQGATIQIEYTIKVENKSEVDYDSENYYKYGIIEGNIIQMKPEGVYDYLDSQMVLDDSKDNSSWEVVSRSDYDNTYSSPTVIEKYFNDSKKTEIREDGTEQEIYEWEKSENSYQEVFTEWTTKTTEQRTVRDAKLENKIILRNANLENQLNPGESNSVNLYTSKVLANTEEIDLNNDTEMTEIRRIQQTGRIPNVITSQIYDRGETVTVTPPTGDNQNYIMLIVTGLTALMILGAGIVIIKKKVM